MTPADSHLVHLLERTSRTFALAIPCLEQPLQDDVRIAYLLFRIADILEDATHLRQHEKLAALAQLEAGLRQTGDVAGWCPLDLPRAPTNNTDYRELLQHLADVVRALDAREAPVREIIVASLSGSIAGMQRFIAKSPQGMVQVASIPEVRDYCYCVAGLVGEMLTALYMERLPALRPLRDRLWQTARSFGEGLQLVNILKDADDDQQDGRLFVASDALRTELFTLARKDLELAERYVTTLEAGQPPSGLLAFHRLPLRLAWRTLERVEAEGPGSKVSREEVRAIVAEVRQGTQPEVHPG